MAVTVTPPKPANEMSTIDVMPEWQQVLFHSLWTRANQEVHHVCALVISQLATFPGFLFYPFVFSLQFYEFRTFSRINRMAKLLLNVDNYILIGGKLIDLFS